MEAKINEILQTVRSIKMKQDEHSKILGEHSNQFMEQAAINQKIFAKLDKLEFNTDENTRILKLVLAEISDMKKIINKNDKRIDRVENLMVDQSKRTLEALVE